MISVSAVSSGPSNEKSIVDINNSIAIVGRKLDVLQAFIILRGENVKDDDFENQFNQTFDNQHKISVDELNRLKRLYKNWSLDELKQENIVLKKENIVLNKRYNILLAKTLPSEQDNVDDQLSSQLAATIISQGAYDAGLSFTSALGKLPQILQNDVKIEDYILQTEQQKLLYIRTHYIALYNMIRRMFDENYAVPESEKEYAFKVNEEEPQMMAAIVAGTPGTGISHFSYYFVYRLLHDSDSEKIIIMYRTVKDEVYLINPKKASQLLRQHLPCLGTFIKKEIEKIVNKLELNNTDIMQVELQDCSKLTEIPFVWYLVDPSTLGFSNTPVSPCKIVVFSSPNNQRYAELKGPVVTLYMPTWDIEELHIIAKYFFPKDNLERVDSCFELFGGIPRIIFEEGKENGKIYLDNALKKYINVTQIINSSNNDPNTSGRLLHIEVKAPDYKEKQLLFPTAFIERKIHLKCKKCSIADASNLLLYSKNWNQSLKGIYYENVCHITLQFPGTFRIRKLDKSKEIFFDHPGFKDWNEFHNLDISDIKINLDTYYTPESPTYPSIDSFYVKKVKDYAKHEINAFQMTVAETHPEAASGLIYVYRKVLSLGNRVNATMNLWFIVPDEDTFNHFEHQKIDLSSYNPSSYYPKLRSESDDFYNKKLKKLESQDRGFCENINQYVMLLGRDEMVSERKSMTASRFSI